MKRNTRIKKGTLILKRNTHQGIGTLYPLYPASASSCEMELSSSACPGLSSAFHVRSNTTLIEKEHSLKRNTLTIEMDHHVCNTPFGINNFLFSNMASFFFLESRTSPDAPIGLWTLDFEPAFLSGFAPS